MFVSYLLVFVLAAIPLFELIAVVPLAIIGGLSPVPVSILGFLGNLLTVLLLIVFIDRIKLWRKAKKQKKAAVIVRDGDNHLESEEVVVEPETKKEKRARELFEKYGLPGLTIIGPFFVGSHISAFMAMSFSAKRTLVTVWMIVSLVLWTIVSAVAASYGVSFFYPNVEENGFLIRIFN
ncbi:small multi-drug export protein [Bacillus dakarensis]|uniref:small multi-drug export protein n=1 Tax=Robertmurraya dakarensis TaxID=1926278 RepID=UPI0009816DC2|nr:small multi-drug export protein [Bacillus dakarensis]